MLLLLCARYYCTFRCNATLVGWRMYMSLNASVGHGVRTCGSVMSPRRRVTAGIVLSLFIGEMYVHGRSVLIGVWTVGVASGH